MLEMFNKGCLLVAATFGPILVLVLQRRGGSFPSRRDRSTALLVFLVLYGVKESVAMHVGWFNERLVATCASGLVAGPWVGLAVGVSVTGLAALQGLPWWPIGLTMLCGGLAGGWIHRCWPGLARRPLTGFCLTVIVSWLRTGLIYSYAADFQVVRHPLRQLWLSPVLQGLGTALILEVIALVREREAQAQATALAEVCALQARMNPHFLCNALNTLAALATTAPREVPRAAGRLRHFLRACFDQPERPFVPLREELAVVHAYLDIERLRLGERLRVEETVAPGLAESLIPPFTLQPLVENAVQHGLHSSPEAGRLWLWVHRVGPFLELSVRDDGRGVPAGQVERVFFGERPRTHALVLLRRRLRGLFGRIFQLEALSDLGRGTTVTMRIPLRVPRGEPVTKKTLDPAATHNGVLLPH